MTQGSTVVSGLTNEFETLQDVNKHLFDVSQSWAAVGVITFRDGREFVVRVLEEPVHYAFRLVSSLMISRNGKALIQPIYRSSGRNNPEVGGFWVPTSGLWTDEALRLRYANPPPAGWLGKHYYVYPTKRWVRHDKTYASVRDPLVTKALRVFRAAI